MVPFSSVGPDNPNRRRHKGRAHRGVLSPKGHGHNGREANGAASAVDWTPRAARSRRHRVRPDLENGSAVKRETAAIRQRVNVAELAQAKDGMARWGRFQAFGRILASTENFHCPCFAL